MSMALEPTNCVCDRLKHRKRVKVLPKTLAIPERFLDLVQPSFEAAGPSCPPFLEELGETRIDKKKLSSLTLKLYKHSFTEKKIFHIPLKPMRLRESRVILEQGLPIFNR
ncbi:hypothetical protein AVEN_249992-1 [Araneus ventricosus]|uniref:Uncharacterized protein n=1 Tax=Araneus ventricosus TaxID=182803 RepID=A0A4Y2LLV9_ARAVE|nr:hypothetical protein AVEN_249992-1 [Araneus ventricosus]